MGPTIRIFGRSYTPDDVGSFIGGGELVHCDAGVGVHGVAGGSWRHAVVWRISRLTIKMVKLSAPAVLAVQAGEAQLMSEVGWSWSLVIQW